MSNKVLEKTLKNVDKEDMNPGWASGQSTAVGSMSIQDQAFNNSGTTAISGSGTMTVGGSARAAMVLFAIIVATGTWAWVSIPEDKFTLALFGGIFVGLAFGLITTFKPKYARVTAPLYAVAEGVALGAISKVFEYAYNGIVVQAILATGSIVFVMYTLYATGVIKVTQKFRKIVIGATMGVFVFYMLNLVLGLVGVDLPLIGDTGLLGIVFSLVVIVIAASNLALDFDFIERGAQAGLPKYMNWAAGYGLAVTVVWIYLEVLRLLSKIRN
ncbi:MAG: Bax inhibitor-1/YccA family protein [Acidimicrobiia bacterium]|nr:Bax inhibitor-1/YccA family protein [Acidimicrobiia bacterium]